MGVDQPQELKPFFVSLDKETNTTFESFEIFFWLNYKLSLNFQKEFKNIFIVNFG